MVRGARHKSTFSGSITAAGAFVCGAVVIVKTLIFGANLQGYPAMRVVILFPGGIQLIAPGIIGEYLARTFSGTRNRTLDFVEQSLPARARQPGD